MKCTLYLVTTGDGLINDSSVWFSDRSEARACFNAAVDNASDDTQVRLVQIDLAAYDAANMLNGGLTITTQSDVTYMHVATVNHVRRAK